MSIHTDSPVAPALSASAFTLGDDIHFAPGRYDPASRQGQRLLGHELAHVVQQRGGRSVRRSVLRRAFTPQNADMATVTAATRLTGGISNKGVFLLTGEGGRQIVAKFVDEAQDLRRPQMADAALSVAGIGSSGSVPYGKPMIASITAALRRLAVAERSNGHDAQAAALEAAANRADNEASAVTLMTNVQGLDLDKVLEAGSRNPREGVRAQAQAAGLDDPRALLALPAFQFNLGKMYVADGLIGYSDRLFDPGHGGFVGFNASNMKVLADGTINAIDNDTLLIAQQALIDRPQVADKSTANWAKFLVEGVLVQQELGIAAPSENTHNLLAMFDAATRREMYDAIVVFFKRSNREDWSGVNIDLAAFDRQFVAGMIQAIQNLLAGLDQLLATARRVGGADRGGNAVDAEALKVKAEFMRAVLPEMQGQAARNEAVGPSAQTKQAAYNRAKATAESFAPRRAIEARRRLLTTVEPGLTPVPPRERSLNAPEKVTRTVGRLVGRIGGSSAKSQASRRAKELRKGADAMDSSGLDSAYNEIAAMGVVSHRQEHAYFDVGLQRVILAAHRRANEFSNADADVMKMDVAVNNAAATRYQLQPYLTAVQANQFGATVTSYRQAIDGYRQQLTRRDDTALVADLARAEKELVGAADYFDASIDYIARGLHKVGV